MFKNALRYCMILWSLPIRDLMVEPERPTTYHKQEIFQDAKTVVGACWINQLVWSEIQSTITIHSSKLGCDIGRLACALKPYFTLDSETRFHIQTSNALILMLFFKLKQVQIVLTIFAFRRLHSHRINYARTTTHLFCPHRPKKVGRRPRWRPRWRPQLHTLAIDADSAWSSAPRPVPTIELLMGSPGTKRCSINVS